MKLELIDTWDQWWKRWSTWLAGLNATILTVLSANQGMAFNFATVLPQPWRVIALVALWIALFGVPVLTAQLKQPNLGKTGA
jgi:hypothetical protein